MATQKDQKKSHLSIDGENGRIWSQCQDTPAPVLKDFKRPGGFQGTSIDPMWRVKKMTEMFGPVGQGWNFIQEDQWTDGGSGAYVVFVRGHIEYREKNADGSWTEWFSTMSHTGGTVLDRAPDEGYKMAETDAFGKCCCDLGMSVDVYTGTHDGDKYQRDESGAEMKPSPRDAKQPRGRGPSQNKPKQKEAAFPIKADEVESILEAITKCGDDVAIYSLSLSLFNRLLASMNLDAESKRKVAEGFLTRRAGLLIPENLGSFKKSIAKCVEQGWIDPDLGERIYKLAQSHVGQTPGE